MKWIVVALLIQISLVAQEDPLDPQTLNPTATSLTLIHQWQSKAGDSLQWRMPGYDSDEWDVVPAAGIWKIFGDVGTGFRWYRRNVFIEEELDVQKPLVVSIPAAISAYELYWDGILLGGSGVVGNAATEVVGLSSQVVLLPKQRLYPGTHTLALRVSNFHTLSGAVDAPLSIGYFGAFTHNLIASQGVALFLAGIFVITALFHMFIFISPKRRTPHILFSLFALSCAGHIMVATYLSHWHIDLNLYYPLAFVADVFWFGMMALLPIFLLSHFRANFRKFTTISFIIITLVIVVLPRLALYSIIPISWLPYLDGVNRFYAHFSILVSIAIAIGATVNRRDGARTILAGLFAFLFGVTFTSRFGLLNGWSIGFAFLNIFITIAIARQLAKQRRSFHVAELRTARLELELLKKHIQPHFLLNSLNSIVAWIEEEPNVAATLVNALSRELRLLMAFAGERLIPLTQEVKLCQTHLEVMNMRQEKEITFRVEGPVEGVMIPPLILHTLVENGLSHGFRKQDSGEFLLVCKPRGRFVRLMLTNDGSSVEHALKSSEGGTGSRYILSRLQESFGGEYAFQSKPSKEGWKSMIRFRMVEQ